MFHNVLYVSQYRTGVEQESIRILQFKNGQSFTWVETVPTIPRSTWVGE